MLQPPQTKWSGTTDRMPRRCNRLAWSWMRFGISTFGLLDGVQRRSAASGLYFATIWGELQSVVVIEFQNDLAPIVKNIRQRFTHKKSEGFEALSFCCVRDLSWLVTSPDYTRRNSNGSQRCPRFRLRRNRITSTCPHRPQQRSGADLLVPSKTGSDFRCSMTLSSLTGSEIMGKRICSARQFRIAPIWVSEFLLDDPSSLTQPPIN